MFSFNNNKHLLLVDGIPVHQTREYKLHTEERFPLFFAKNGIFLPFFSKKLVKRSGFDICHQNRIPSFVTYTSVHDNRATSNSSSGMRP